MNTTIKRGKNTLTTEQKKALKKRTATRRKALAVTLSITPTDIMGSNPQLQQHKRTVREAEAQDTTIIARTENKEWTLTSLASYSSSRDLSLLPLKENMALYLDSLPDLFQTAYLALVDSYEAITTLKNDDERISEAFKVMRHAMRVYIGSLDAFSVDRADKRYIKEVQLSTVNPVTKKPIDYRTAVKLVAEEDRNLDYWCKTSTGWEEAIKLAIDEPLTTAFDFEIVLSHAVDTLSKNEIVVLEQILSGKKTLASVRKGYKARAEKIEAFILDYCKANHQTLAI